MRIGLKIYQSGKEPVVVWGTLYYKYECPTCRYYQPTPPLGSVCCPECGKSGLERRLEEIRVPALDYQVSALDGGFAYLSKAPDGFWMLWWRPHGSVRYMGVHRKPVRVEVEFLRQA